MHTLQRQTTAYETVSEGVKSDGGWRGTLMFMFHLDPKWLIHEL